MSAKKVEPISRPYFRAQVLRLAETNYFPALDEGVKELVDSLIRVSGAAEDRARRIIDQALENSPACPAPADFAAISSKLGSEAIPRGCEKCEGTGLRYVSKTINRTALDADGKPYVYETYQADCQERCDCELGHFLKAKEKEARASSPERKPAASALSAQDILNRRAKLQGGAK